MRRATVYRPATNSGFTIFNRSGRARPDYPIGGWFGDVQTGDYRIVCMMNGDRGYVSSVASNSSVGNVPYTNSLRSTGNGNAGIHIFGENAERQAAETFINCSPLTTSYQAMFILCLIGVDMSNPVVAVTSQSSDGNSGTVSTVPTPATDVGEHLLITFIAGRHTSTGIGCTHSVPGMTHLGTAVPRDETNGVDPVNTGVSLSAWTKQIPAQAAGTISRTISPAPDNGSFSASLCLRGLPLVSAAAMIV